MNPLEFFTHFVNVIMACTALASMEQRVGGETYQVKAWVCQMESGPVTVKSWARQCDTGRVQYWGREAFVDVSELSFALYGNQFGEIQGGSGAMLENAYLPPCGS